MRGRIDPEPQLPEREMPGRRDRQELRDTLQRAESTMQRLVSSLAREGEGRADVVNRIYLIDPIGNLVLSYQPDSDPSKMRRDLSRLLRVSQIG